MKITLMEYLLSQAQYCQTLTTEELLILAETIAHYLADYTENPHLLTARGLVQAEITTRFH